MMPWTFTSVLGLVQSQSKRNHSSGDTDPSAEGFCRELPRTPRDLCRSAVFLTSSHLAQDSQQHCCWNKFLLFQEGKITFLKQDIPSRRSTGKYKIFPLAPKPCFLSLPCGCLIILQVPSSCKTQPRARAGRADEFKGLHVLALVLRWLKAKVLFYSACISNYYTITAQTRGEKRDG